MTFNHLPIRFRFFMFLNRAKAKLLFAFSLYFLFSYWGNFLGLSCSRVERSYKKYKKRWVERNNPAALTYASATETMYKPKVLSS